MPIYEYYCGPCEVIYEQFYKSIPDEIPTELSCDACDGLAERIISLAGFSMGKDSTRIQYPVKEE